MKKKSKTTYFGGQVLSLVGDQMDTGWELIDGSPLAAQIEDTDLGIRDTTAETRLGIRLILDVAVTTGRTASHFYPIK